MICCWAANGPASQPLRPALGSKAPVLRGSGRTAAPGPFRSCSEQRHARSGGWTQGRAGSRAGAGAAQLLSLPGRAASGGCNGAGHGRAGSGGPSRACVRRRAAGRAPRRRRAARPGRPAGRAAVIGAPRRSPRSAGAPRAEPGPSGRTLARSGAAAGGKRACGEGVRARAGASAGASGAAAWGGKRAAAARARLAGTAAWRRGVPAAARHSGCSLAKQACRARARCVCGPASRCCAMRRLLGFCFPSTRLGLT